MKKYTLVSCSELDTALIASSLANVCNRGVVINLHGPIGVGKSVFCKGFLRSFGYFGNVNSPTYTLVESYCFNNFCVYHFDCYRIDSIEELEYIGVRDYLNDRDICLVEWSRKNKIRIFPVEDISVQIEYCSYTEYRKIIVETSSILGKNMLTSL